MPSPFTALTDLPGAADEEFLYHLYRGSDLLQDGRISDAKEALERALEHQPKDARGQDLLACVYFRLGVYPRAIEIYRRLVGEYPREPVLRVNLAIVYLKTGQPDAALAELKAAIDVQPDHQRAHSYLGLVYQQLRDPGRAREAYLRAGLAHMARRMDQLLEAEDGSGSPEEVLRAETRKRDVRGVATQAFQEIDAEDNPFLLEREREGPAVPAAWEATEPGEEPPRPRPTEAAPVAPARVAVSDLLALDGAGVYVDPGGALVVSVAGTAHARLSPLLLWEGVLEFEPCRRRAKGRERDDPFGEGEGAVHRVRGTGRLVLAPAGARHYALRLADETAYVREDLVAAFTDELHWESGQVALAEGGPLRLASFRGHGTVALRVRGEIRRVAVRPQDGVTAEPGAVAGWTGRLLPRLVARPGSNVPALLHLAGDGMLLVVVA